MNYGNRVLIIFSCKKCIVIYISGTRPFKCDFCEAAFTERISLNDHKRIHTGEMPYKCDQCEKGFVNNSALIIHKRTHTGEKPFSCDECMKKFAQKCNLIVHKKRIHGGSCSDIEHSCDLCRNSSIIKFGNTRLH